MSGTGTRINVILIPDCVEEGIKKIVYVEFRQPEPETLTGVGTAARHSEEPP